MAYITAVCTALVLPVDLWSFVTTVEVVYDLNPMKKLHHKLLTISGQTDRSCDNISPVPIGMYASDI